jgi:hypothetical protein
MMMMMMELRRRDVLANIRYVEGLIDEEMIHVECTLTGVLLVVQYSTMW